MPASDGPLVSPAHLSCGSFLHIQLASEQENKRHLAIFSSIRGACLHPRDLPARPSRSSAILKVLHRRFLGRRHAQAQVPYIREDELAASDNQSSGKRPLPVRTQHPSSVIPLPIRPHSPFLTTNPHTSRHVAVVLRSLARLALVQSSWVEDRGSCYMSPGSALLLPSLHPWCRPAR